MNKKYELLYGNTNKVLKINAHKGESYIVEAGAMVSMSDTFEVKSKLRSIGKTIGSFFSGESIMIQKFIAKDQGELIISPKYLGDIEIIDMDGTKSYKLGQSSFLASTSEIDISIKTSSYGKINKDNFLEMEAKGEGDLFISSYGAIHKKFLRTGECYIVDTSHLLLWDSRMKCICESVGLFTSIKGSSGFVTKFTGPGEIWIQTRNPVNLI